MLAVLGLGQQHESLAPRAGASRQASIVAITAGLESSSNGDAETNWGRCLSSRTSRPGSRARPPVPPSFTTPHSVDHFLDIFGVEGTAPRPADRASFHGVRLKPSSAHRDPTYCGGHLEWRHVGIALADGDGDIAHL